MYSNTFITRCVLDFHPYSSEAEDKTIGHSDRVGGVAWHPEATLSLGADLANLVSGAGDNNVHLWSLNRLVNIQVSQ